MAIGFFQNFHKLEELIQQAQSKYQDTPLAMNELSAAESALKHHVHERDNFHKLCNFTASEGDEIVARVRQQDAHSQASEAVRQHLGRVHELKRVWEQVWERREKALRRCIETSQIVGERSQIDRDLDLLLNEIEHRKRHAGSSYEQVIIPLYFEV